MNKKVIFLFISILVMLGYIFKIDKIIQIQFTSFANNIKSTYNNTVNNTYSTIQQYYNQLQTIKYLQNEYNKSKKYELLYKISDYELNKIRNINFIHRNNNWVKYVEVLSYKTLNDFTKVILDTNITKKDNIFALATVDGYSAGIVINEDNENIAYLNPPASLANTIVAANSANKEGTFVERSFQTGKDIAAKLKNAGIAEIVFDRNGFQYTGRVKALADALREEGIKF